MYIQGISDIYVISFLFGSALDGFWESLLGLLGDGFFGIFGLSGKGLFTATVAVGRGQC